MAKAKGNKKSVAHLLKRTGKEPKVKADTYESGEEAVKVMSEMRGKSALEIRKQNNLRQRMGPEAKLVYLAMKVGGFKKVKIKHLMDALYMNKSDVDNAVRQMRNAGLVVSLRGDYENLEVVGQCEFAELFGEVSNG